MAVSMPVGGIGTGTIGFGGRGQLRDWELENRPAKGSLSNLSFLACWARGQGLPAQARVLEGTLFDYEVQGAEGSPAPLAGLPRFEDCEYQASYPFARVVLSSPGSHVAATVEAFNPLCPGDPEISGLPIAVLTVTLVSLEDFPLECSVMLSFECWPGHASRAAGRPSRPSAAPRAEGRLHGYLFSDDALEAGAEDLGTVAAAVLGDGAWEGSTWGPGKWNQGLLAMWRQFEATGRPGEGRWGLDQSELSPTHEPALAGTVGTSRLLPPRAAVDVTFVVSWHFPHRRAWIWGPRGPGGASGPDVVGNSYAVPFADAWAVVATQAEQLPELRAVTEKFVSAFWASDLPPVVKEAALFNLSTLRSQTFFRTADGDPMGWEGCLDHVGSCLGSCTHVWNYDMATPSLFGGLARRMRELEFLYATGDDGAMSFRVLLPLDRARERKQVAADGQFGCILKLYREWRLFGGTEWLQQLWPACRRTLEFAWTEGGWDGDGDGLAEGPQHNTMDVEYFGPNPVVQSWYLAALKAAQQMAAAVGDVEFSALCARLVASGSAATEEQLFNGSYYCQRVVAPGDFSRVPARLRDTSMGAEDARDPEFQIGDGCILDQLVGHAYAQLAGLGPVLRPDHVKAALASIHHLNYVADFGEWTNYMRTYAVRGERGHVVAAYPGGLPEHPLPYWCEVWTGLEYVYAVALAQAGEPALAEDVVAAARERYSGRRRNPFDEAECGHHYARALASWGLVVALTGFGYNASEEVMSFACPDGASSWFWSNGTAWGTLEHGAVPDQGGAAPAHLHVLGGEVSISRVRVGPIMYRTVEPGVHGQGRYELLPGPD